MRRHAQPLLRLRGEQLETRDCPAVQVFNQSGLLSVVGDPFANDIEIVDNGTDVTVLVDGVAAGNAFTGVSRIVARGAGGDDSITFTASASSAITAVKLQGGRENDTITIDAATLDRIAANATTRLSAFGGQGSDRIDVSIGSIAAGDTIALIVSGAAGPDNLNLGVSGEVDGTLSIDANSDQGSDTISASIILSPGSTGGTTFLVRGGQGNDNLTLAALGELSGSLTFQAGGGQGNDTVSVSGTPRTESSGTANITANGGQGTDTLTLSTAVTVVGSMALRVQGGQGSDSIDASVTVAPDSSGTVDVLTSGGTGPDTINLSIRAEIDGLLRVQAAGDIGLDTINSTLNLLTGSTGRVQHRVDGGLRKDTLTSTVSIDGGAATASALDALLGVGDWSLDLDGGLGFDTGTFTNGVVGTINLEVENPV